MDEPDTTCPTCGIGSLADISYDAGPVAGAEGQQAADSRQVTTYACGHRFVGASLGTADHEALDVERRSSRDTTVVPRGPEDAASA